MAVFKCKMCGADLNITEEVKITECEYCGSTQTLPSMDNEKKLNLFNRANRLRMACEFDKAATIYENIIAEFPEEPESYWGLCLCNYGIEYVDDPATAEKKPTCHRASFEKLSEDENFNLAMEYADVSAQRLYRQEAREIDRIMDEILSISKNEKPYDVFICYKETDNMTGQRTTDSVFAQDIYDALTSKGLKVFFSRITLEDKLGIQYEPYIFAALNTAKVMLAVGTSYENFHAVWVKNEWSRFIKLSAKDKTKVLIPCFRDMDPYDLPDEFRMLQAQDLGKVGSIQDLTRGVIKIVAPEENTVTVKEVIKEVSSAPVSNTEPLLKRAFMFLEDGNWTEADVYCEKVLDLDPENAKAYLGKLMAELKGRKEDDLKNCATPFDDSNNYQKILRFADDSLKNKITGYVSFIKQRIENERIAAENARIAAENARIAAEKAKEARRKECKELLAQLKVINNGINQKEQLKKQVEELRIMEEKLKRAATVLPQKSEELQRALQGVYSCNQKLQLLQTEKGGLGLFAGKRKKEIDEEISLLSIQLNDFEKIKAEIQSELCGCYSEAEIKAKLKKIEEKLLSIQKKTQITGSKEEIIKNLQSDEIGRKFFAKLNPEIGKEYIFGSFEQDGNTSNGKEDIEWIVLDKQGDSFLLISKYGLDVKPYNTEKKDISWEHCTLRKWLNEEFYNSAFSEEEKNSIEKTNVVPHKNPIYGTNPGNATADKVFLLSIEEAKRYFKTDEDRICMPTKQARNHKAWTNDSGACWWWLRSPGLSQNSAAGVYIGGGVSEYGLGVNYDDNAVRPALWINLNS